MKFVSVLALFATTVAAQATYKASPCAQGCVLAGLKVAPQVEFTGDLCVHPDFAGAFDDCLAGNTCSDKYLTVRILPLLVQLT
jgi:hypothetical protein